MHRWALAAVLALLAAAPAGAATLTRAHAVLPVPAKAESSAPATAEAAPDVGARSIGDEIFPTIGNGGYDARHYDIALTYTPGAHMLAGTTTMNAVATQPLREFSMDFDGFTITALTVDGKPATSSRDGNKLIIDPATPLAAGQPFSVAVTYSGTPPTITDEDGSDEGFLQTPDGGAMVVCEPVGSMGWFPNNDTPADKATYDISITVPPGMTVLANGRLVSNEVGATGQTWHWRETEPMASYLSTATLAVMQYTHSDHGPISIDVGVAAPYVPLATADGTLDRIPEILDLFGQLYGPYPFSEAGAIVGVNPAVGYALETQTKPNFPLPPDPVTLAHELSHQYWGDSLSLKQWRDIWLNEGFATWSEWVFDEKNNGGSTTAQQFAAVYAKTGTYWSLPPADPGSGANIFATAVYQRGGATLEGLREIVGEPTFLQIMRTWYSENRDGNVTTADFIATAKRVSGRDLDAYFQQWLYGRTKPTITPQNFNG
jgi:aminopeptidase N